MHELQLRNFLACIFAILLCNQISNVSGQNFPAEFAPQVTATCKGGLMNIKVFLNGPYVGAVHARGYRNPKCMSFGNGSDTTTLTLNLLSKPSLPDYCGIVVNSDIDERSVQLAIRVHKTLELAEDKYYIITCGRTGVIRDRNTEVVLKFLENDRRVRELVYGHRYSVKAEITKTNGTSNGIRVKNCIAFDQSNLNITLIDNRGCPIQPDIITKFKSNSDGTATAVLKSMFKFPEGSGVHLQCSITPCMDCSDDVNCDEIALAGFGSSGSTKGGRFLNDTTEDKILAATTVFVQEPSEKGCENGIHPAWLLWLAITLGILFLIMLLMNIFLCTAMSCSCARTEIIEKEPSIIEEYDPYRSWHGSQYGSRYSLHGRDGPAKGYTSGGSTIHSNRSDRY